MCQSVELKQIACVSARKGGGNGENEIINAADNGKVRVTDDVTGETLNYECGFVCGVTWKAVAIVPLFKGNNNCKAECKN